MNFKYIFFLISSLTALADFTKKDCDLLDKKLSNIEGNISFEDFENAVNVLNRYRDYCLVEKKDCVTKGFVEVMFSPTDFPCAQAFVNFNNSINYSDPRIIEVLDEVGKFDFKHNKGLVENSADKNLDEYKNRALRAEGCIACIQYILAKECIELYKKQAKI